MPTFFNTNNRKGVFMIPAGATKSPSGNGFSNTKSLSFDGVDESISVFNMPVLNTATELTFSFWGLKASGNTLGIEAFSTSTNRVILYWWQDDNVYWNVRNGSSSPASSNSLGDFSNWHHFAGTYNGATGTIKLYLDGSLVNTQTGAPASTSDLSSLFTIGISNNTNYNNGNIDEVAIFDSELNSDNINQIYNSGVPTNLNDLSTAPVIWYRMGDNSTYKTPQILMPENTNKDKVSNWSLAFDGVGDYIDLGTSINLGTNSTISFWFKSTTGNTNHTLIGENTYSFDYLLQLASGTNTSYIRIGSVVKSFTTTELNDGNWNHWCIVRSGDSIELFINNVSKGTQTGYGTGTNTLFNVIGAEGDYQFPINGSLDEFAVWDSVQDVSSIYNGGQPTTITGATAYWKLGEQATFSTNWTIPDQVGSNDGTSANMTVEDRIGDAPNSENNAVSFNMEAGDIDNNTP